MDNTIIINYCFSALGALCVLSLFAFFVRKKPLSFANLRQIGESFDETENKAIKRLRKEERRLDLSRFEVKLGKDEAGKDFAIDLNEAPHTFFSGRSGSGKTNLLLKFLTYVLKHKKLVDLYIFGVHKSIPNFSLFSQIGAKTAFYKEDWEKLINELWKEREDRTNKINQAYEQNNAIQDIVTYNNVHQKKIPYIIVVLDEIQEIVKSEKMKERIQELTEQGRSTGIFLVASTQNMNKSKMGGDVLANASTKIGLPMAGPDFSKYFLGYKGAELLKRGEAIVIKDGLPTKIFVNLVSPHAVKHTIKRMKP